MFLNPINIHCSITLTCLGEKPKACALPLIPTTQVYKPSIQPIKDSLSYTKPIQYTQMIRPGFIMESR